MPLAQMDWCALLTRPVSLSSALDWSRVSPAVETNPIDVPIKRKAPKTTCSGQVNTMLTPARVTAGILRHDRVGFAPAFEQSAHDECRGRPADDNDVPAYLRWSSRGNRPSVADFA